MKPIIENLIVVLGASIITWLMTIKIQFAKDEKTAMLQAVKFILSLVFLFLYGFTGYSLYLEFSTVAPLTRESLLSILLNLTGILSGIFCLFMFFFKYQFDLMSKHFRLTEKQGDLVQQHIEATKAQSEKMKSHFKDRDIRP